MKYMGDSTWWNERFKSRNLNLMKHEKYLEKDIGYFTDKNKILDVACGDGRNAIYLACMKHQVSCLDFSEEPLDNPNITESDILKEDDFRFIRSYTLVDRNEYDEGQRKFVRYIWKK